MPATGIGVSVSPFLNNIYLYAAGSYPQYRQFTDGSCSGVTDTAVYYTDDTDTVRKVVRDNKYSVDITLSSTGFDGVEDTDWTNLFQIAGRTDTYRNCSRNDNFVVDGTIALYDDWFMPSKDELNAMYTNLHAEGVGDFSSTYYWSSSEYGDGDPATTVWVENFSNGAQNDSDGKDDSDYPTRPCRTFTASEGAYSLRDTGPAGGLIFYIDGTTYYEAAASNLDGTPTWSNVLDTEVGTGTAIGTGQANTTAIVAQDGHTASAAEDCDDLESGSTLAFNGTEDIDWENLVDMAGGGSLSTWRDGVRDGAYVRDIVLTATGFSGVENTDWEEVAEYKPL